jgi:hypothetical protein
MAKISYVYVLVSLATNPDWLIYRLDVKKKKKKAFSMVIYLRRFMEQPSQFVAQGEYWGIVCKLNKALYSLKQSPRAWFEKFSEVVMDFGLHRCQTNHSVFHLHIVVGYVILVVYVDDIVITGSDSSRIIRVKQLFPVGLSHQRSR